MPSLALLAFLMPSCCSFGDQTAGPSLKTFQSQGVRIRYVIHGKGTPVVLIHGMHSSANLNWELPGIVSTLAKDYQVIALDLRGHGGSEKPDREEAYGIELVNDVVRLLAHLKIKKAHIIGYSMGGVIAVKFIAKHPDRVLTGVLGGMGWFRQGSGLQKAWEQMRANDRFGSPPACVHSIGKLAVTADEVKSISVPMVILVGDRDPVRRLYVAPLQQIRPDWPVKVIEDAGHINCIAKPEFKKELARWLAGH